MIRCEPHRKSAAWRVFRTPVALCALAVLGLAAALFGEGALRWFSWFALGLPLWLCLWYPARAWRRLG
jgi:hypothetical protein